MRGILHLYSVSDIVSRMKQDIHPKEYRPVIFVDNSNGAQFLIPSTIKTSEKGSWTDGKEYPLYRLEITSASHPFYTNQEKVMDTAGRVEKFRSRQSKKK